MIKYSLCWTRTLEPQCLDQILLDNRYLVIIYWNTEKYLAMYVAYGLYHVEVHSFHTWFIESCYDKKMFNCVKIFSSSIEMSIYIFIILSANVAYNLIGICWTRLDSQGYIALDHGVWLFKVLSISFC